MPELRKDKAIVLSKFKYSDELNIVHLYTQNSGKIPFIVRKSSTKKNKATNAYLQALQLLNIDYLYNPKREMQSFKEINPRKLLNSIYLNPNKRAIAFFLSEFLSKVLKEEMKDQELFSFIDTSINVLDEIDSGIENFHLYFLMKLSRFLGVLPLDNFSNTHRFFSLNTARFEMMPQEKEHLSERHSEQIYQLLTMSNFNELKTIKMNRDRRNEILSLIIQYFKSGQVLTGNLKSQEVLMELYD